MLLLFFFVFFSFFFKDTATTEIYTLSLHDALPILELVELENRLYRLKTALTGSPFSFDYILIDCPPALGLLTLNALVAAHSVLVPLQCEFFALEGISHLDRKSTRLNSSHW